MASNTALGPTDTQDAVQSFKKALMQILEKSQKNWDVLHFVAPSAATQQPSLVLVRGRIQTIAGKMGLLESSPQLGPIYFHAAIVDAEWSSLRVDDAMTVLAEFDDDQGMYTARLLLWHSKVHSESEIASSGHDEISKTMGNQLSSTSADTTIDELINILSQDPKNSMEGGNGKEQPDHVAANHVVNAAADSGQTKSQTKPGPGEVIVRGLISGKTQKFAMVHSEQTTYACFLGRQAVSGEQAWAELEAGDSVEVLAEWNQEHSKWQALKVLAHTSERHSSDAVTLNSGVGTDSGSDTVVPRASGLTYEDGDEIDGWSVLDCLLALLDMQGGQMKVGQLGRLYECYPGAERVVRDCGGLRAFCSQHSGAIQFEATPTGDIICRSPSWVRDSKSATVLQCLLALIDKEGGRLASHNTALLYRYHPEAKTHIRLDGGTLKGFCCAHRQLTFIEKLPTPGLGYAVQRSQGVAAASSSRRTAKQEAVVQGLVALIDEHSGTLPVRALHLLHARQKGAFQVIAAAGGLKCFMKLCEDVVTCRFDATQATMVLQRRHAPVTKSRLADHVVPAPTGAADAVHRKMGDAGWREPQPQAQTHSASNSRALSPSQSDQDAREEAERMQTLITGVLVKKKLFAFVTASPDVQHPTFLDQRLIDPREWDRLCTGDEVTVVAEWQAAHAKWRATHVLSVSEPPSPLRPAPTPGTAHAQAAGAQAGGGERDGLGGGWSVSTRKGTCK